MQHPAKLVIADRELLGSGTLIPTSHDVLLINIMNKKPSTYDHRVWTIGLPVRSAILKPHIKHARLESEPVMRCYFMGKQY